MSGRYLLDTNIIIALFADGTAIKNKLESTDEIFIPAVVIGELCFGALKSGRPEENLGRIDELTATSIVIGCDTGTAPVWRSQECVETQGPSNTRERHLDCRSRASA